MASNCNTGSPPFPPVDCQKAALAALKDAGLEHVSQAQWDAFRKRWNDALDHQSVKDSIDIGTGLGVVGLGKAAGRIGGILIIGDEGEGPAGAVVVNNLASTIKSEDQVIDDIKAAGQTLVRGDATNMPFPAGAFDKAVGVNVPSSIKGGIADEAQRVTGVGTGNVYVTTQNGETIVRNGLGE